MAEFEIHALDVGPGQLALSPLPGAGGAYDHDLSVVRNWDPDLVISMTTEAEMQQAGAAGFGDDVQSVSAGWQHLPIEDFGAPPPTIQALWPETSASARQVLARGGRVLVHCRGGCGRSGMVVLRLMIESGEAPAQALARLRATRPCAVETVPQMDWAMHLTQHSP
ncbi:protein-tyrosine phosphatase family protein [Ruegeria sp. R14_0]|uniref:protein-tyrosine phosphatase family protein n=1 Tax=Ruegeria sp. R14_0 TaxID=2821100 RepID=UPI001ADAA8C9|nr:protein-tyrosine phosphatase family protein [Ruegeria sp. R14_0]MBO9447759.1 dual specificity protein phosphatase family protein [Ruegeria sp. R14_0]